MAEYFKLKSEERKNRSKEEKKVKFSVCGIKININIIYKSFNETFLQKKSFAIKLLFDIHQAEKLNNDEIQKEYGFCIMDGHKEKIGNFKIEPPGLFRGRGDHPKQGMLKRRTQPEDVIINCSK